MGEKMKAYMLKNNTKAQLYEKLMETESHKRSLKKHLDHTREAYTKDTEELEELRLFRMGITRFHEMLCRIRDTSRLALLDGKATELERVAALANVRTVDTLAKELGYGHLGHDPNLDNGKTGA